MKREKLWPPYLWRWLVQQQFQRRHSDAPVMVANAVFLLNAWLKPTDTGIEWGSGRSTAWIAERCANLTAVEHDRDWYSRTSAMLAAEGFASKVDYRFIPAEGDQMNEPDDHPYAKVADDFDAESLDFVIVDGQMRCQCARRSLSKLKPGGLLVLDGANRYLPNRVGRAHTTVQQFRDEPLGEAWAVFADAVGKWRGMHTSDGLWDTRFWVKPT